MLRRSPGGSSIAISFLFRACYPQTTHSSARAGEDGSRERASDRAACLCQADHGCRRRFRPAHRGRLRRGAARAFPRARPVADPALGPRSEEHTSELQSQSNLVCRLLLEKKKIKLKPLSLTQDEQKLNDR